MSSSGDSLAFLDARIAELRRSIDSARHIIERATADIKVLEQAKAVLSRNSPHASPTRRVGLAPLDRQLASLRRLTASTPSPPPPRAFGGPLPPEGSWQRLALKILEDGEAHGTAEIFMHVGREFGDSVKYPAVASWLLRAEKSGKLEKDGRGMFRLMSQETLALRDMGFGLPTQIDDALFEGEANEEPVGSEEESPDDGSSGEQGSDDYEWPEEDEDSEPAEEPSEELEAGSDEASASDESSEEP